MASTMINAFLKGDTTNYPNIDYPFDDEFIVAIRWDMDDSTVIVNVACDGKGRGKVFLPQERINQAFAIAAKFGKDEVKLWHDGWVKTLKRNTPQDTTTAVFSF